MKKFLFIALAATFLCVKRSQAQCNGANVAITNFVVSPSGNTINFSFDWEFVQGNASIEVVFLCNNVQIGSLPCIPRLKDSTAGPHPVSNSFNTTCSGTVRVEIRVWANPTCGGTFCSIFREISHAPLPVTYRSFSAIRSGNNVNIKWQTASEQNNTGFAVERNIGGTWEQVAWVPSRAMNGNSEVVLDYSYTDANRIRGITQYRIRQVDIDSRSKYSEIRAVRGDGQLGSTIIYPNPSKDGTVNISFEDATAVRNIIVADLNGRVVREFNRITNNNISVKDLKPGMYTIRISVMGTGEQVTQKIMVSQR